MKQVGSPAVRRRWNKKDGGVVGDAVRGCEPDVAMYVPWEESSSSSVSIGRGRSSPGKAMLGMCGVGGGGLDDDDDDTEFMEELFWCPFLWV